MWIIVHVSCFIIGCNIYGISRPGTSLLRMVVAVNRKLLIFNWKHSAEWLAWCSPTFEQDSVEGFTLVRVGIQYEVEQIMLLEVWVYLEINGFKENWLTIRLHRQQNFIFATDLDQLNVSDNKNYWSMFSTIIKWFAHCLPWNTSYSASRCMKFYLVFSLF